MAKINVWYVVGKRDPQCCFEYSQVTPKGEWFNTWEEAERERVALELVISEPLFVFRRTCEVLHNSKEFNANNCKA